MKTELVPLTLDLPPNRAPRSPGTHVSAIIRAIAGEQGILKPEYVEDFSLYDVGDKVWWDSLPNVAKLRMAIGMAWEPWYIASLGDVIPQPGEMCVNGMYMTHDGESMDVIITDRGVTPCLALHEVKTTSKSTKTVGDLSTQWLWLAQTKAYCKGLNTLVAYLHVLFLCGDYSWPMRPRLGPKPDEFTCWRIEYTQAEIDDNWDVMTEYVKHRQIADREDYGLEGGT